MGKNKLSKFADMDRLPNVLQYPYARLQEGAFPHRGKWGNEVFGNDHPIIIELGCGRGEYTIGLARRCPECNFIAIDIKGNRMWNGATIAHHEGLTNVRFLRTEIELLDRFFTPGEVSEIWITFPDPQMKKARLRLTSTRFISLYAQVLRPDGLLHLKTDSGFLFSYTQFMAKHNHLLIHSCIDDVDTATGIPDILRDIHTYYEEQWRSRGITIKYLCLQLPSPLPQLEEPDIDIEPDEYRSFGRSRRTQLNIR